MFIMYTIDIITKITADTEHTYIFAVEIDIQSMVCCIISCWCMKFIGRRPFLLVSGVSAICCLLVFCVLSYLMSKHIIPWGYRWLQLAFLILFFLMRDIAIPVTHNIVGEVFPLSHRGLGVAFIGLAFTFISFGGAKLLPTLMSVYGIHGAFLVITTVLFLSLTYLYFFLPETYDNATRYRI